MISQIDSSISSIEKESAERWLNYECLDLYLRFRDMATQKGLNQKGIDVIFLRITSENISALKPQ